MSPLSAGTSPPEVQTFSESPAGGVRRCGRAPPRPVLSTGVVLLWLIPAATPPGGVARDLEWEEAGAPSVTSCQHPEPPVVGEAKLRERVRKQPVAELLQRQRGFDRPPGTPGTEGPRAHGAPAGLTVGSLLPVPGHEPPPRVTPASPGRGQPRSEQTKGAPKPPSRRAKGPRRPLGRRPRPRPYLGSRGSAGPSAAATAAAAAAARAGVRGSPCSPALRSARLRCALPGGGRRPTRPRGCAAGQAGKLLLSPVSLPPARGLPSFLRLPGALAQLGLQPTPLLLCQRFFGKRG